MEEKALKQEQNPEQVHEKEKLNLSLGERVDMIRTNRYFLTLFPFVSLALIILIFGILTDNYLSARVIKGILSQGAIVGVCAIGVSFIYSNGNIDISIGSVLCLAACLGAVSYNATGSIAVMVIVAIGTGVGLMFFNSILGVILGLTPAMIGVVMTTVYSNVVKVIVEGKGYITVDKDVVTMMENMNLRYILFIGLLIVAVIIFHVTRVGRELRLIGGNENCAKQSGVSTKRATITGFLMAGLAVGIGAFITIFDTGSISATTGDGMGMDVMLATVLGGMSIFGGSRSNAYAGFLGAITVVALNKGLLMVGVPTATIQGVRGVIFLLLVFMNSERSPLLPSRQQF